jgi:hypothetical protein
MPDARPEDVLVAIPARDPVTRGLAGARDRVLDAAKRRGRFDVIADGGCGKTRLLEELAEGLRDLGHATLFITISPQRKNTDELSEADRMRGEEVTYHRMIAEFASDVSKAYASPTGSGRVLDPETGRRIEQRMNAAASAMPPPLVKASTSLNTERSRESPVADSGNISVQMGDTFLLQARWIASLDAFVAAVRELAEHCPVAILVDDLHLILGTESGRWLLGALDQLPGILTVHARRPDAAHAVLGHAEVVRLVPMNEVETGAYARYELPDEAAGLGSLVFELTGGYPVWVGACCQMIAAETARGVPASRLRERLLDGAAPLSATALTDRFATFVDDYCAGLLRTAAPMFDLLTVLQRVSRIQLARLLAEHGFDEGASGKLFDWLKDSGFMTAVDDRGADDPGGPDIDDGGADDPGEPDIRLHDVIRHEAERKLRRQSLTRYRELHASAERYYRKTMNFDYEPEESLSLYHQYGTRYEDRRWQANSLEWLHHASQVDDEAFRLVMRAMVRLFLDAFWWYESDFPMLGDYHYCRTLLADYRSLPRRRSGEQWLWYLEAFHENYVADTPNREPGQDSGRWEKTQDALRGLWNFLQLDRRTVPDNRDLRRIQILLSIFRGDAEYYGGTGDERSRERAAAWYTEAEQAAYPDLFDRWIANWALYLKADLYVDADPSRAKELAQALPKRIDEQEDNEFRVYLIWLYGDLAWNAGDKALAFDIYARSVLHAFVFHLRQESQEQNPSRYTVEFYQMFMDWTRQRLDEAKEEGLGELVSIATGRMNALFAPYWAHEDRVPDNAEGFPSQPKQHDLGIVRSQFADTVRWVLDAMQDRLEEPLDGPLS